MSLKNCMLLDSALLQPSSRKDGQWLSPVVTSSVLPRPDQGKPSLTAFLPLFTSMLNPFSLKETVPLSLFLPQLENSLSKSNKNVQNLEKRLVFATPVSTVEFPEEHKSAILLEV